ncbi:MAG: DUF192 domain-containing protein [Ilumatobacteraceae bacterium]|jgi:uncharacterized membrane protein (UPF0127 family)|nr:DUF192 domain-containing protein [Actinomycetota bacterium]MDA3012634.1 DUF192 domain-containing protein [Actinomycetota bacterium]MDA3025605.1 DUF192 domain-containing protein [Actinomycetota bacterium]
MTASETSTMVWLVTEGRVLASAEMASDRASRRRGLLGRTRLEGAFILPSCRWVHTIGMKFPIDVAYLDADGVVVKTVHMPRHRVGAPVWRARTVVEASAGSFGRWGVRVGDRLEIRSAS